LSGAAPNLTYTPALNYHGTDSFAFTASDGSVTSAPATVSITVNPVNDAPAAQPQIVTVSEDSEVGIELTGTDIEEASIVYNVTTNPQHGTLIGTAPALTYTPATNYHGEDSFTFRVNDGELDSAEATVLIHVTSVPDVPTAFPLSLEILRGSSGQYHSQRQRCRRRCASALKLSSEPMSGSLGGSTPNLSYTPDPDLYGDDYFTLQGERRPQTPLPLPRWRLPFSP
jgi:hypothetical protein